MSGPPTVPSTEYTAGRAAGQPAWTRWALPSLADLVFVGVLVAAMGYGPRMLNMDGDLGRHLTIGEYILQSGTLPTHDLWSHTRYGAELVPHEWVAEVAFALAARAGGLAAVALLTAVTIAATFWVQARWLLSRGFNAYLAVLLVLWAVAASSLHWLTRPHVFTYPLALVFAWTLDRWRIQAERGETPRRALWALPLLMALWANLHGAFVVGLVLIGLHLGGAAWQLVRARQAGSEPTGGAASHARLARDLALTLGLCLAATMLNPVGPALLLNSFGYVGNRYLVDHTVEYMSPDFHQAATWPFAGLVILAIFVAALARRRRGGSPAPLLVLLAWLGFGLYSTRNVPLFAIVAVPVLAELADGALAEAAETGRRWAQALVASAARLRRVDRALAGGTWAVAGVVVVAAVLAARPDVARAVYRFSPRVFPVAAADYLAERPLAGPMFNEFIWGGYLLYREWPAQRVFIDGQTDFYGEALTREYAQVSALEPGWQDVLGRYGVAWIIVPATSPLGAWLADGHEPSWREVWRDETAVIFVRQPAGSQAGAAGWRRPGDR